ncbi:MAG: hypothetical protein IKW39_03915 [Alphaproteobacteria bacterium]|nr:hypothetical protein [Alphaproteobacteria bacterium]
MLETKLKKLHFIIAILLLIIAIAVYYSFSFKRYAVFAGYNPDGIIKPYVLTYLKGLEEVTDGIVYITDSKLNKGEEEKLKSLNIIYQQHIPHNEYDWGSYKRGYNWLKANGYLSKSNELIFANDSTYAPITSFKPMFITMFLKPYLDFWGDLKNNNQTPHLQSYFLVFRPKVFNSEVFNNFINNITAQKTRNDYINEYEIPLTATLSQYDFKWDCYIPYDKLSDYPLNDKHTHPVKLIKDHNHQFIKRRTFTDGMVVLENPKDILLFLQTNYPKTYQDIINSSNIKAKNPPSYLKEKI